MRESYFNREDWDVQDAGIGLAQSERRWLDAHGNSAANRIELAESTSDTLDYPYISCTPRSRRTARSTGTDNPRRAADDHDPTVRRRCFGPPH
ncbi:hypothetical protein [Nocardia salmonicida]|uniref:hypothetical protein n=1 Tax=Nocardia salmonicida TaxID=53431 RepID=UPI00379690C8